MFLNLFSAQHIAAVAKGPPDALLTANLRALGSDPGNRDALFVVGSVYASREKWAEAVRFLERLARLDPLDAATLNDLSICHWNNKNVPSCHATLLRLTDLDPSSWFAHDMLCAVCRTLGRTAEALFHGEEALRRGGSVYGGPLDNLGGVYCDLRQYEKAGALFARAITLESDNGRFKEHLAQVLIDQGRFDEAGELIDEVIDHGTAGARTRLLSALCHEGRGELGRAVAELNECMRLDPGDAEALRVKARLQFKLFDFKASISSYILAGAMSAKLDEQDYLRMGDVYLSDGSIVEAIEAFEKSIAVSSCPDPRCPVHGTCFKTRITEEVFSQRSESRLADPGYQETLAGLAAESPQEHDHSLVAARYNECLRSRAGYSKTHQALCGFYLSQGKFEKALSEILTALKVDPEDGPARYLEGCVYSGMHERQLAIRALETCLRSSPYHKQASDLLSELRQAGLNHRPPEQ